MNGRLAALAEQAGYFIKFERTGDNVTLVHTKEPGTDGDLALFGELVVRECGAWIVDYADTIEHLGTNYFAQAMLKDFGVKKC